MSNQEILTKAIEKAIVNGWLPYFATFDNNMRKDNIVIRYPEGVSSVNFDYQMKGHIVGVGGYNMEPMSIIYDHDFAKALWGEPRINAEPMAVLDGGNTIEFEAISGWQFHLQKMVIAPNPIKYLGDNL